MRKSISSKKIYVTEIYTEEKGWVKINKKLTVKKVYEMFEAKEIESISIIEDDKSNQTDYNYINFRESFCTLEKYYEKILDEVKSDINLNLGINIDLDNVKFLIESTKSTWDGIYREYYFNKELKSVHKKNITMRMSLIRDSYNNPINKYHYARIKKVLYHEIGHYIHDVYFNYTKMDLSTVGKSYYARTNQQEDFAEAFMDLVSDTLENRNYSIRDMEMFNFLQNKIPE